MNEEIVVQFRLELSKSGQDAKRQVDSALNSPDMQAKAREAGRKIGQSLSLGIETGRNRQSAEQKELAHFRRIESITLQNAARIQQIEARKQAQLDTIRERGVQKEIEHARKIERETQRAAGAVGSFRAALGAVQGVFAALAAVGVVALFERVGRAAVDAAVGIDRQVSSLTALTGSAEAAEKRFAALVAIAQKTPGLTTSLAATLDTQLRVFNVAEQTINKLLPVIGRLNAISPISDPRQLVNNITQLITQNFERQDLKELVGQSPIAGQLIKQIFNVDNPTNAEAIRAAAKKLGVTSVERLAEELVKAGETNSALKNAVETLGGQFDKLRDRLDVALAPLGKEIAKTLLPLFDDLAKAAEKLGPRAANAFSGVRTEVTELGKALLEVASAMGHLSSRLGVFDFIKTGLRGAALIAADFADIVRGEANPFGKQGPRSLALQRKFEEADRIAKMNVGQRMQFATATGDLGALPTTEERRAFALATGDLSLLATLPPAPRDRIRRPGGGGGGADGGAGSARRARDLFEGARSADAPHLTLAERQKAIDANMTEVFRALVRDSGATEERLGRSTRATLTQDFEARLAGIAEIQRAARRDLNRSGQFIGDAFNRGQLTPEQAEAMSLGANREFANVLRDVLAQRERLHDVTAQQRDDLQDEIELYDRLGTSISSTERFMRGFNSATISVGDAFERFGQNVSRALTNTRDLLNGLKQSVLQFFNDLLGSSLQNLMRQVFAPIAGIFGGAGGGGAAGGIGNLFRTPSTFPANLAQAFAGGGGGGISAPPSVSLGGLGNLFGGGGFFNPGSIGSGGGGIAGALGSHEAFQAGIASSGAKFSLSGLGKSFAAAAPLLGLSLGSGVGGQSIGGSILGGAGGLLGGLVLGASTGAIGGSLGSLFALSGALGPAALIAAPLLLVGGFLLGKAKQRRQDEEASGEFLRQALQGIDQLAAGISSGQIDGSQARSIFDRDILGVFRQQISGLKTKSVRDSRLTNQVRDLENVYQARIPPLIAEQEAKQLRLSENAARFSRMVPEFAGGGLVPGADRGRDSVLSLLRPGEMVLTRGQQASVMMQSNPGVFDRAGVPRTTIQAGPAQAFQFGGTAQPAFAQAGLQPIVIENLNVSLLVGKDDATRIVVTGGSTSAGRAVTVKNINVAKTNREL